MNRVTAAAVKLKALIRKQMDSTRKHQLAENSSLAQFMLTPIYGMAFVLGLENDQIEGSSLDLDEHFEGDLAEIFKPMEFQEKLAKIGSASNMPSNAKKSDELCGPDALMRAKAQLELKNSGCPSFEDWKEHLEHYDVAKHAVGQWNKKFEDVNILDEYQFCKVLGGFRQHGYSRSVTEILGDDMDEKDAEKKDDESKKKNKRPAKSLCKLCGGCRGHAVLGVLMGLVGFYIFSFWAPQGDSYAWVYYPVDTTKFVKDRCIDTNATADPSPWCSAPKPLIMSRTTLWIPHSVMLRVKRGLVGVCICAVLKALVCAILGGLFASTVAKTVSGLQQAWHPMYILDGILAWWARTEQMTTCHLHVWKLARDSILHNDVKNILDRYENVVLAYLAISFWLITDSAVQIAIFNNAPNVMAGYMLLVVGASTFVCVYQALSVHYIQIQHRHTLKRLKEATYFCGGEPDREHQRKLLDEMIARMSADGGDYQTTMLYMPLNPVFQKTLFAYFVTAAVGVAVRLISESFTQKSTSDWGVLAPVNASLTQVKWMAGGQQITMTVGS